MTQSKSSITISVEDGTHSTRIDVHDVDKEASLKALRKAAWVLSGNNEYLHEGDLDDDCNYESTSGIRSMNKDHCEIQLP